MKGVLKAAAAFAAFFLVAGETAVVTSAPAVSGVGLVDSLRVSQEAPGDWLLDGRSFDEQRFSPLKQIDRSNVGRLGFAWEFRNFLVRGGIHRGMESNPVFVDGILYFSGPWGNAYAVDARSGKSLWTYDSNADGEYGRKACCDVVNRGVAVWKGRVYVASLDGYLVALDAKSGKPVWRVDTIPDRRFNTTVDGAPHIAGDNILIGNAGADMGSRGYASAYDAATGKLAWRFWAVPGDPARGPDETPEVTFARRTWAKDTRWDLGGGGNPWDSMAYDPKLGLAYLGLGNGGPHPRWLRSPGGGDNLFLSSIVAVDAKTGRLKWYYQETPGDSWDYTATAPMVLADLKVRGRLRHVILQAPKNGIFYVLDRETGELLNATPFTTVNWTDRIDRKSGRPHLTPHADYSKRPQIIWPSSAGGHGWQPMSFDPETGLLYLPVYDAPMKYQTVPVPHFIPGDINQGSLGIFPPYDAPQDKLDLIGQPVPKMEGRLKAWDPASGRALWTSPVLPFLNGGTLSTAGGLVFQGTSDGNFSVYDARTGRLLKHLFTGTSIMAAPVTYLLDGKQYVAVMAGAGGPQNSNWAANVAAAHFENFERLLVFRLDGGPVPVPPRVQRPARQPTPKPIAADSAKRQRGAQLYVQQCARCHLANAFGAYPDLWNMPPAVVDRFAEIVRGGALRDAGMGNFSDTLSASDLDAIKAFIVDDEIDGRSNPVRRGSASARKSK